MFTLYWSVRPFGAAMLLACKDFDGYSLYLLEPSGECQRYFGNAVGKGRQNAKNELEKLKLGELTCEEGVKALARIIFATHDEKDKEFEARPYHTAPKCSGHLVTLLLRENSPRRLRKWSPKWCWSG